MRRKSSTVLAVFVAITAMVPFVEAQRPGDDGAPVPGRGGMPIGSPGHPLGATLKIEGVRINEGLAHGTRTLRVDTVNGKKLPRGVDIRIEGESLPERKRCIIEGYESVKMTGTPPAVEAIAGRNKVELPPVQGAWGPHLFFVPLAGDLTKEKGS